MQTILFATGIRGSQRCWKKLINAGSFYGVQTIILGGNLTGGDIFLIEQCKAGYWTARWDRENIRTSDAATIAELESQARDAGFYPHRATSEEGEVLRSSAEARDKLLRKLITKSISSWLKQSRKKLAGSGKRLFVLSGGADPPYLGELFPDSDTVIWAQNKVLQLENGCPVINQGFSEPTPWKGTWEMEEDRLLDLLETQISEISDIYRAIFNMHAPPFNTGLDDVPADELPETGPMGARYAPMGSRAVRRVIEKYQPLLSLHGLTQGSRRQTRLGRTLCLNPGSLCRLGILSGFLISLDARGIHSFQPVQG
ncbi:MAG: hypothetical protein ACOCVE_04850 [Desulfovermiculus sp.]